MGDKNSLFLPYFFNSLFMSNVGPWNDDICQFFLTKKSYKQKKMENEKL